MLAVTIPQCLESTRNISTKKIFVKEKRGGRQRGRQGVITACEVIPTQEDRSRTSGSQSQSRHSPPRPCAGDHLHSRPGDSLRDTRK